MNDPYHHVSTTDLSLFSMGSCECYFIVHGFKRVLILNGHGGNTAALDMFTRDVVTMIERMLAWDGASWSG